MDTTVKVFTKISIQNRVRSCYAEDTLTAEYTTSTRIKPHTSLSLFTVIRPLMVGAGR